LDANHHGGSGIALSAICRNVNHDYEMWHAGSEDDIAKDTCGLRCNFEWDWCKNYCSRPRKWSCFVDCVTAWCYCLNIVHYCVSLIYCLVTVSGCCWCFFF